MNFHDLDSVVSHVRVTYLRLGIDEKTLCR